VREIICTDRALFRTSSSPITDADPVAEQLGACHGCTPRWHEPQGRDERESVKETALVGVVLDPEEIQPGLVRFPSLLD
jgi:hypothetical protein